MDIPPGFEGDALKLEQLEAQRRQDPRVAERLIQTYEQILDRLQPDKNPIVYAMTLTSLGLAYIQLPMGDLMTNLRQAIACFQKALDLLAPTSQTPPFEYAMTLISLGSAYSQLPMGDRTANLRQAIACYQEALRFWTPETAPLDYALAQVHLGSAYSDLPARDRVANLERAIACYQEALRFWTPETAPLDYALTQTSLGNAYSQLPAGHYGENVARAIACCQEALRFLTLEAEPFHYAMTQASLGNAYRRLPTGDRANNLGQAIACYQRALRFWTPETAPFEYASAQTDMGNAYRDLPTGDHAANLGQAIACYQRALNIQTPEITPAECRRTYRNLAHLHFAQGEWQAAFDAYRAAIDAGERLYRAGLSAEGKGTEMAENSALYRHAAFSAVRCGETAEALLILERGKTRLLAEALRLRVPRPANVPDDVWDAFERAGADVRTAQSIGTIMPGVERDPVQAYAAREQSARAAGTALNAAIEQVRVHAPEFLRAMDPLAIQALLPDEHTVLVAFCITEQGGAGFVVGHNYDQNVRVVEAPQFTQAALGRLLIELDADRRAVGGWLGAYNRFQRENTQAAEDAWKNTITNTLAELGQRLLAPILSALSPGVEHIIFLPSAELFLLPLHAAPLSDDGSERVCDRYQVSYAPSLEVLADTRAKAVQGVTPDLYAVVNPTADPGLAFVSIEGEAIARLFARRSLDGGRTGTKQRMAAEVQGRTYAHFACHGNYDWDDPTVSGLELADGRLTLAEVQQGVVDLSSVRLVTLSACETGITDVVQGSPEEYVGLPAGFLLAGVPCVVSSLWAVPDLSTALLMERFYRNHLKGGMDFAASLREAQVWVRELDVGEVAQYAEQWYRQPNGRKTRELFTWMRHYQLLAQRHPDLCPFAHPYSWAAFTVNGM